jgi:hypothetical protein
MGGAYDEDLTDRPLLPSASPHAHARWSHARGAHMPEYGIIYAPHARLDTTRTTRTPPLTRSPILPCYMINAPPHIPLNSIPTFPRLLLIEFLSDNE